MSITNAFTPPLAAAALETIITAAVDDPTVLVQDGLPTEEVELQQRVYITDTLLLSRAGGVYGSSESYDLAIAVEVEIAGDDRATFARARDRAYELLAIIDRAVAADPTLSGVVTSAALLAVDRQATRPYRHGWFADAMARVSITALVT